MIEILNELARWIGFLVLFAIGVIAMATAWYKYRVESTASPEAKQMAKELDPNNPVERAAATTIFDGMLKDIRDLQPDETIRAEPKPLTHFDWSVDNARQEDVEHILSVLQEAGYYTHPLPKVKNWKDSAHWTRERAGVWRHEPDWHIVEFEEETGRKEVKEQVDVPIPNEWRPET